LRERGYEVSCVGVAQYYQGLIGTLIIDEQDAHLAEAVAATGCAVRVTSTIMAEAAHAHALATEVLA